MKSKLILATFNSGSTYIQRALTFWIHELQDRSVRNPHELLNGIAVDNGYLVKQWQDVNAQTSQELVDLLASNRTPLVMRLAYDHYLLRQDPPDQLGMLFDFLKENFDIYYSRRDNLFDYAMCYAVRRQTQRDHARQINNVYTVTERNDLYGPDQKFTVVADDMLSQAQKYQTYIQWVQKYFDGAVPIDYERIEEDMDSVLQEITGTETCIRDHYGITVTEYTRLQYQLSKNIISSTDSVLSQSITAINDRLQWMVDNKIMLDSIPIKSTTVLDKLCQVNNFDHCVEIFNHWASQVGLPAIDDRWLSQQLDRSKRVYQDLT